MSGRSPLDPGSVEAGREALNGAGRIEDPFRRSLLVLGILSALAARLDAVPILVGGAALEWYTFGGYFTRDLDVVCEARDSFRQVLEAVGFTRRPGERHWYHSRLDVAIEVPDERLAGSRERVAIMRVNGYEVRIIGVEDLILDRLRAFVHWRSQDDLGWAARLLALHGETLDSPYLEGEARREHLGDALRAARRLGRQHLGR